MIVRASKFLPRKDLYNSATIALLCHTSKRSYVIQAEKEELESKSSRKSDIQPSAASKKWGEIFGEYFFRLHKRFSPEGDVCYKTCESKYHT